MSYHWNITIHLSFYLCINIYLYLFTTIQITPNFKGLRFSFNVFPNQSILQPTQDKIQGSFAFHPNRTTGCFCFYHSRSIWTWVGMKRKSLSEINYFSLNNVFLNYPLCSVILFHDPSAVSDFGWWVWIWIRIF